jgi:hypothetical protein
MHTTTKTPRRENTAPYGGPSGRGRRVRALGAVLFVGLMGVGALTLPSGSNEAPSVGPPTWQEIASTSTGADRD